MVGTAPVKRQTDRLTDTRLKTLPPQNPLYTSGVNSREGEEDILKIPTEKSRPNDSPEIGKQQTECPDTLHDPRTWSKRTVLYRTLHYQYVPRTME